MIRHFKICARATILSMAVLLPYKAVAGEADVLAVDVLASSGGTYRFDVTVAHADEGWDHYGDAYEVLTVDGNVLGLRVLAHPHVDEQPFTRSLSGVKIPASITTVLVRAHDKVHGWGGKVVSVTLPPPP